MPNPTLAAQVAGIVERHVRLRDICEFCQHTWPCDTSTLLRVVADRDAQIEAQVKIIQDTQEWARGILMKARDDLGMWIKMTEARRE